MFTGLIQALGKIEWCNNQQIAINCPTLLPKLSLGDSVAVNGVCLTVAEFLSTGFIADVSPETLNRTNLGSYISIPANLELSLSVGDKLGGHFVTGHIDGTGTLTASQKQGDAWEIHFKAAVAVGRYIVSKGSVAVNGISLTVASCNPEGTAFSVAVIPHTYENTNLHYLQVGSPVNLEGDILGKYVEKLLRHNVLHDSSNGNGKQSQPITSEFLAEHGWH